MGPDIMILVFWMFSFKPAFSLSAFTFIKRLFSSSSLSVFLPRILIWGNTNIVWSNPGYFKADCGWERGSRRGDRELEPWTTYPWLLLSSIQYISYWRVCIWPKESLPYSYGVRNRKGKTKESLKFLFIKFWCLESKPWPAHPRENSDAIPQDQGDLLLPS